MAVLLAIVLGAPSITSSAESRAIQLHRIERDETRATTRPADYECARTEPPILPGLVCVERRAAFVIPFDEVERAVLRRMPILENGVPTRRHGYELRVRLTPAEADRFGAFASRVQGEAFDARVGDVRLHGYPVSSPDENREFNLALRAQPESSLLAALEGLGKKLEMR